MKRSESFVKTLKEAPSDEVSRSAQLLLRAGYIYKEMAGVYDFLPMGRKVLNNIIEVIREEMLALGGQEVEMSSLQPKDAWEKTNRWDDKVVDDWFKTKLHAGGELGLALTHEEAFTNMLRTYVSSYKDLPLYVFQFQKKFRNELRAKSGIMRTREFIMKDLYSFCTDKAQHDVFYEKVAESYIRIFKRLGIGDSTYRTFASGGSFSKFSDEFQTICDAGEDIIYIDHDKNIAINEEVYNEDTFKMLDIDPKKLDKQKASEVGNIFTLGTKYSDALGLEFNDEEGKRKPVFMGSYGIGPARTMGVIAEKTCDDKGLCWPEQIAPYKYYLIGIGEQGIAEAEKLYAMNPECFIFDDRTNVRNGEKFADAELMGIPYRVVISDKTLAKKQIEILDRKNNETKLLTLSAFTRKLS